MKIEYYHKHNEISDIKISEIIEASENKNWKPGQVRVLTKFMRGEKHISHCVKLTEQDKEKTFFAFRGDRKYPSKMLDISLYSLDKLYDLLKDQQMCHCTAVIKKIDNEQYFVLTAFWGRPAPKEPGNFHPEEKNSQEYKESIDFWKNHALIPEQGEHLEDFFGEDPY